MDSVMRAKLCLRRSAVDLQLKRNRQRKAINPSVGQLDWAKEKSDHGDIHY
jgi:hypothetical protein